MTSTKSSLIRHVLFSTFHLCLESWVMTTMLLSWSDVTSCISCKPKCLHNGLREFKEEDCSLGNLIRLYPSMKLHRIVIHHYLLIVVIMSHITIYTTILAIHYYPFCDIVIILQFQFPNCILCVYHPCSYYGYIKS